MWLDAHLDMAWAAVQGRDLTTPCPDRSQAALSLPDLAEGDVRYAFATIFTDPPSPQMIATNTTKKYGTGPMKLDWNSWPFMRS